MKGRDPADRVETTHLLTAPVHCPTPETMTDPLTMRDDPGPETAQGPSDRGCPSGDAEVRRLKAALAAQASSLAHARKIFARASEAARIGVWECTLDGEHLTWTDVVYDLFDLPRGSALDRAAALACYTPSSRTALDDVRSRAIREGGGFTLDAEIVTGKGNRRWIRLTATVEREDGVAVRIFGMKQDITEEKTLADRTRYLAEFDALTGLANRARFQVRLAQWDEACAQEARCGALLLVDLDGFKQVNDTFGHLAGDTCLRELASRLGVVCAGADLVARIGGDEFAVLTGDGRAAEALAGRIVAALGRPIEGADHVSQLGASVGIAFRAGASPGTLFARADTALYAAKAAGRNTFRTATAAMVQAAERRLRTLADLSAALDGGHLDLHYVPRRRLADGRLCGFEALPRWRGADGRLAPAEGLPTFCEDPALARRLGLRVLEMVACQAATWMRAGLDIGHISLPRAAAPLRMTDFAEMLTDRIAAHRLPPGLIEIEISETALAAGAPGIGEVVARLRAGGVRVALGDFGAGGASLRPLNAQSFDALRLDASFLRDALATPRDGAVLEAAVRLARRLGLEVAATGIAGEADRDRLLAMGCTTGDGPWIGAPLPAAEAGAICRPIRRSRVA